LGRWFRYVAFTCAVNNPRRLCTPAQAVLVGVTSFFSFFFPCIFSSRSLFLKCVVNRAPNPKHRLEFRQIVLHLEILANDTDFARTPADQFLHTQLGWKAEIAERFDALKSSDDTHVAGYITKVKSRLSASTANTDSAAASDAATSVSDTPHGSSGRVAQALVAQREQELRDAQDVRRLYEERLQQATALLQQLAMREHALDQREQALTGSRSPSSKLHKHNHHLRHAHGHRHRHSGVKPGSKTQLFSASSSASSLRSNCSSCSAPSGGLKTSPRKHTPSLTRAVMEVLSDHPLLLLHEADGTKSNSSTAGDCDDDISIEDGTISTLEQPLADNEVNGKLHADAGDDDERAGNAPQDTTVDAWSLLPTPAAAAATKVMADMSPDPSTAIFAF
jgi:hypothetical protein